MNLRSLIIQKKLLFINKQILKLKKRKTVYYNYQTVLFLYRYDYTMGQVHLISFLVLALQDQYNLEVFLLLLKIRLFSDFDRRIQDDRDVVGFENLLCRRNMEKVIT